MRLFGVPFNNDSHNMRTKFNFLRLPFSTSYCSLWPTVGPGELYALVDRHTYLGVIIGAKRERIISSTPSPYQISVSHQFITPTSECKLN